MRRKLLEGFVVALVTLAPAYGQVAGATLVGTVNDSSGAALPGVEVTATQTETGFVRTTIANESGDYRIPNLPLGRYSVSAQKQGFKKQEIKDIVLQLDQTARVDLSLQPGAITEVVEVTGAPPLLASTTSDVGAVIENKQIVELPLNRREFLQLALLGPGVVEPPPGTLADRNQGFFTSVNAMGTRQEYQQVTLHGITNMDPQNNNLAVRPNVEAIQEFKIQTSNYSADLPTKGGIVVNLVIKSGTNSPHGSLYEFVRNSQFDARNFFSIQPKTPPYRQNQYGGSFGGPIVKNRTFGFFAYEGLRTRLSQTGVNLVPDENQRQGIFDPARGIIYDPQTWNTTTLTRQPFANNRIPQNRMHPTSLQVLEFIDLPNNPNDPRRNLISNSSARDDFNQYNSRFDHIFREKDSLMFSYNMTDRKSLFPVVGTVAGGAAQGGFAKVGGARFNDRSQQMSFAWSHIFSPNTINEFRGGFVRYQHNEIGRNQGTTFESDFKIPETETRPEFAAFPTLSVAGYNVPAEGRTSIYWNSVYQLADGLTLQRGSHALKIGWSGMLVNNFNLFCVCVGSYSFSGQYVGRVRNTPGDAFADFLMGNIAGLSKWDVSNPNYLYGQQHGVYFQDDWRATSRLTLNFGVRYDYQQSIKDKYNRLANWDPVTGELVYVKGVALLNRDPRKGQTVQFVPQVPHRFSDNRGLYETDKMNFAPRFGYAYRLKDKWVSRGAFGVFNGMNPTRHEGLSAFNPPFTFLPSQGPNIDPDVPTISWQNGFTGAARAFMAGLWKSRPLYGLKNPYILMWNQGFQRQIKGDILVDLAYVGSVGHQQTVQWAENVPPPGEGNAQLRRPFTSFGGVTTFWTGGNSAYHSLQAKLERRFSKGLAFTVAYSFSKSIDTASSDTGATGDAASADNPFSIMNSQHAVSAFDIPHRIVFNYVWEIPYGKRFGNVSSTAVDLLLGGWQATGLMSTQSGYPFTVTAPSQTNGSGGSRPNRICSGALDNPTINQWFDASCFVNPQRLFFGNSGRNILRADGRTNVDIGIYKNFAMPIIGESGRLQFRAEAFNLRNHANFGIPVMSIQAANRASINDASAPRQVQFSLKLMF